MRTNKAITVREAIDKLLDLPPHAFIRVEGCDCYGLAGSISFDGTWVDFERTKDTVGGM